VHRVGNYSFSLFHIVFLARLIIRHIIHFRKGSSYYAAASWTECDAGNDEGS
jgi:hypothetical protein